MNAPASVMATQPSGTGHARKGAIRIQNVDKIYDAQGAAVQAVSDCTLDIRAGEICMIVGPSGCGKTTLLNAIAAARPRERAQPSRQLGIEYPDDGGVIPSDEGAKRRPRGKF